MDKRTVVAVLVAISQAVSCTQKPVPATPPPPAEQTTAPGERAPSAAGEETPWTTWSEKGQIGGLLVLKHIREDLLKNNLHDPHINYSGYAPIDCSKRNIKARSADGTCNVVDMPYVGASGVAFGRNVSPEFIDKDAADKLMTPNPAVVSKTFFTRDEFKPVPFLNMLAAVWIQFMNHDWMTHGRNLETNPYAVKVPGAEDKEVERTKENAQSPHQYKHEFGKTSLNEVTHWWDASQIYGSSQDQQNAVRSFSRGKLRTRVVNGREVLPARADFVMETNKQNQGDEVTGFKDNWWMGLSMLHTLFVKEHNAIADMLMKKHVTYDKETAKFTWTNGNDVRVLDEKGIDQVVFDTARLINAAVLAKIHTVEWTPAILPNPVLRRGMYTNWYGLLNPQAWSKVFRNVPWLDKTDWFAGTQSGYTLGGIVGDKTNNFGVPFSITEEFTSVYRLHSLLPENLEIRHLNAKDKVTPIAFAETRNEKASPLMAANDLKDLYYSFGMQHPGQLVLNNFPRFMQELKVPGLAQPMDLGMVDIMRDRERGVPRYNQFRRAIGLKPIAKYADFFPGGVAKDARQQAVIEKFNKVYGKAADGKDNVESVDLLVGTLAEEVRPSNFGFGETMFQIFILMASRRLMADRFYTEYYRAEYYTQDGLDWIDHEGRFAQVIGRHMPELKPYMSGLETAFQPWHN